MKICGLMKLTLLDYPEKTACTIFTAGCNFRCPFCHNASLVTRANEQEEISEEEILSFLKKRQGLLDGVCITGGEPLLQPDIEDFIRKVKDLGYLVKLDTNGSFPKKLKNLIEKNNVIWKKFKLEDVFNFGSFDLLNESLKQLNVSNIKLHSSISDARFI